MNGRDLIDSFQLKDQGVFYDKIDPLTADLDVLVFHDNVFLPFKSNAVEFELVAQGFLVNAFQVAWPQDPVDFNGGPDDSMDQFVCFLR